MGLLINKEEMVYYVNNSFDFNTQLGNRAADRIKAAPKLAKILKEGKALLIAPLSNQQCIVSFNFSITWEPGGARPILQIKKVKPREGPALHS